MDLTALDIARFHVAACSDHIKALKDQAAEAEERLFYKHCQSAHIAGVPRLTQKRYDKMPQVEQAYWIAEVERGYINPNSVYWHEYQAVKREATFWIAAVLAGKTVGAGKLKQRLEWSFTNPRIGIDRIRWEGVRRMAKLIKRLVDGKDYPEARRHITDRAKHVEQASPREAAHA